MRCSVAASAICRSPQADRRRLMQGIKPSANCPTKAYLAPVSRDELGCLKVSSPPAGANPNSGRSASTSNWIGSSGPSTTWPISTVYRTSIAISAAIRNTCIERECNRSLRHWMRVLLRRNSIPSIRRLLVSVGDRALHHEGSAWPVQTRTGRPCRVRDGGCLEFLRQDCSPVMPVARLRIFLRRHQTI